MLEIMHGDILDQEADVIVVPQLRQPGLPSGLTARIYYAAGYRDMTIAYQTARLLAERESDKGRSWFVDEEYNKIYYNTVPLIAVTPGFDLKAKHAIHICTNIPGWRDGQPESERREKQMHISLCYWSVLDYAYKHLNAKSVAIPLLGTSLLGFPEEFSRKIGERIIWGWLESNAPPPPPQPSSWSPTPWRRRSRDETSAKQQEKRYAPVTVYLTIQSAGTEAKPAAPAVEAYDDRRADNQKSSVSPTESCIDLNEIFSKYEDRFNKRLKKSKLSLEEFGRKKCGEYLKRISNSTKLAKALGFDPSVISRFKNEAAGAANGSFPKKRRVIAIAISIGLSDYERYEFVRCAGYSYPLDPEDDPFGETVETIIRKGAKTFDLINRKLCEINPEFDLKKPAKISREKKKTQKTK